jgi:hypothetical protein
MREELIGKDQEGFFWDDSHILYLDRDQQEYAFVKKQSGHPRWWIRGD